MQKALFLDRDGTLIVDEDPLVFPQHITWKQDCLSTLHHFKSMGFALIVVTNQAVVAKGLCKESDVDKVHKELNDQLDQAYKIHFDAFYYCPHHPDANDEIYRKKCSCRKPLPGMLIQAAKDHHINLEQSIMIGDRKSDITAGHLAGCKTLLISSPKTQNPPIVSDHHQNIAPDFTATNWLEIKKIINEATQ